MKKNKYNLNYFVWFIDGNEIQRERITEISILEEFKNNISSSEYLYRLGLSKNPLNIGTDILYEMRKPKSKHFFEDDLFLTKEDLIKSL